MPASIDLLGYFLQATKSRWKDVLLLAVQGVQKPEKCVNVRIERLMIPGERVFLGEQIKGR